MTAPSLRPTHRGGLLAMALAPILVLLVAAGAASVMAKTPPNQGAQGQAAATPAQVGVQGQAAAARPAPAAAVAAKPKPAPAPQEMDAEEYWVIVGAILFVALMATTVSMFPIASYVQKGWSWREHVINASLTTKAKDQYLAFYHQDPSNLATAEDRFKAFYGKWFGRSRLTVPAAIIGLIVFLYALVLASYAAQALFKTSLIYLPNDMLELRVAVAAVAGAYTMVSLDAISRVVRRDLLAEDLYVFALRLAVCVPVAYAIASFVKSDAAMVVAFATGTLSLQFIADFLRRNLVTRLGQQVPTATEDDPVSLLSGVDAAVSQRIGEIGITTISQLAVSDPVQLTMRTNLGFNFVLDLVSQALAWSYLGSKLTIIRPMGLRGAFEIGVLNTEAHTPGSPYAANAQVVIGQAATALGLTLEQFNNVLHQVGDDPQTLFLIEAYSS